MTSHLLVVGQGDVAEVTLLRHDGVVDVCVDLERERRGETLAARRAEQAAVTLVRLHVALEAVGAEEPFATLVTRVRHLTCRRGKRGRLYTRQYGSSPACVASAHLYTHQYDSRPACLQARSFKHASVRHLTCEA